MRREEWLDREIRTMVQGAHRMMGVGNGGDDAPVSPLTISSDPPPEEPTDPETPLAEDPATGAPESDEADTPTPAPPPAPGAGTRRAARRKHNRTKH